MAQARREARLCAHTTPRARQELPPALVETRHHRRERVILAVAAAWLAALLVAVVPTLMPWPDGLFATDFPQFYAAAWILRDGLGPSLFDMNVQAAFREKLKLVSAVTDVGRSVVFGNPYFYPPPLAVMFVPFALLPLPWAYLFWSALSLTAFVAAILLHLGNHSRRRLWTVGMLSYLGVIMTLREGQVHGLLTLALSLSLLALAGGRPGLGGVLLGLLWLKPQLALLFPVVFLAKRRWRELGGMAATGLVIAGLSLIVLGPEGMAGYVELLRRNSGFNPSPLTSAWAMVNWRALLAGLIPDATEASGSALTLLAATATTLLMLLAWRGRWEPASPRFPLQVLATVLATAIVTPHSHFSGTALALAPLAMLIGKPSAGTLRPWIWCLLALSYLLPTVIYLIWPAPKWLLAPYYLLAILLLVVHTRPSTTQPGELPA